MNKKREYTPLHVQIQNSRNGNKALLEQMEIDQDNLNDVFKVVFEDEKGQTLLDYLVDTYVAPMPQRNSTPEEIMFMSGQRYIVMEILNRIQRNK